MRLEEVASPVTDVGVCAPLSRTRRAVCYGKSLRSIVSLSNPPNARDGGQADHVRHRPKASAERATVQRARIPARPRGAVQSLRCVGGALSEPGGPFDGPDEVLVPTEGGRSPSSRCR
jgi:hypothetical protein